MTNADKGPSQLSPKQQRFVEEYLIDLNATQAAIRAGYSEKTANEQGCQNLAKLNISTAIKKAMDSRAEKTSITAVKVLADIELIKQDAMKLKSDGVEMINHNAALKACELQGKHLAMWTENLNANVVTKSLPASIDDFV